MRARFAGKTDVGLQREHNEDNLLAMPKFGVMAVADGMGGHRSGDVASQLAVSTLSDFFEITVRQDATWPFPANPDLTDEENYLLTGLRLANRRIFDRSLKTSADFGMGTTIVSAMFSRKARTVAIAHVGDSRAYRIREGKIAQLTRDHSLISDAAHMAPWMSDEEVAQLPPNVITRALGIREDVLVDLLSEKTQEGDIYLLCSDGLSGMVSDEQILKGLTDVDDLQTASAELVDQANFYGGADNITVMLGRVEAGEPSPGDEDYVEDDDDESPADSDKAPPSRKTEGGTTGRTVVEVRIQHGKDELKSTVAARARKQAEREKLGDDETTPKPAGTTESEKSEPEKSEPEKSEPEKSEPESEAEAEVEPEAETERAKSESESLARDASVPSEARERSSSSTPSSELDSVDSESEAKPDDDEPESEQPADEEPDAMDGDTDPDANKGGGD